MSIDDMIAVLQAAKAGKQVEHRAKGSSDDASWWVTGHPSWTFDRLDYRVKPEPREWWAVVQPNGHLFTTFTASAGCIKVREVL